MKSSIHFSVLMLALATLGLAGCQMQPEPLSSDAVEITEVVPETVPPPSAEYQQEIQAWRTERLEKLKLPDGWLSLVGLHWLEPNRNTFIGSGPTNGIKLATGPDKMGLLKVGKKNDVSLRPEAGAALTVNGAPVAGEFTINVESPDTPEVLPTVVGFNEGKASFIIIQRSGRLAVRVRDSEADRLVNFEGIQYFDINSNMRFEGRLEPHPAGKKLDIVTITGMIEPMDNPGVVVFNKDGIDYRLEAVDEGDGRLFLIFADRTSGHETYAAARFLYADPPGPDGKVIVDFNKAYNPPCSYTAFSTCPMPPKDNRIDMRITAGELKPTRSAI